MDAAGCNIESEMEQTPADDVVRTPCALPEQLKNDLARLLREGSEELAAKWAWNVCCRNENKRLKGAFSPSSVGRGKLTEGPITFKFRRAWHGAKTAGKISQERSAAAPKAREQSLP